MSTASGPSFKLGAGETAFLRITFLSIIAASSSADNIPSIARALGCRLSSDLRQVTLLFSASDAREMLDRIAGNGAIAAVFSVPSTLETLQLKGIDARVEKAAADDAALVCRHREAFVDHVGKLGYPRDLVRLLLTCEPDDLAAVAFTPSAAFSQTPGPRAGHPIGVTP